MDDTPQSPKPSPVETKRKLGERDELVRDSMAIVGFFATAFGVGLIYLPAGLIAAGVMLWAVVIRATWGSDGDKPAT